MVSPIAWRWYCTVAGAAKMRQHPVARDPFPAMDHYERVAKPEGGESHRALMIVASSPESRGELAHSGDAADAGAAYAGDSSARDGPRRPRSKKTPRA
jgi:hypothetical protein